MTLYRYTLETNLTFSQVSRAIEGAKPKTVILADQGSRIQHINEGKPSAGFSLGFAVGLLLGAGAALIGTLLV